MLVLNIPRVFWYFSDKFIFGFQPPTLALKLNFIWRAPLKGDVRFNFRSLACLISNEITRKQPSYGHRTASQPAAHMLSISESMLGWFFFL